MADEPSPPPPTPPTPEPDPSHETKGSTDDFVDPSKAVAGEVGSSADATESATEGATVGATEGATEGVKISADAWPLVRRLWRRVRRHRRYVWIMAITLVFGAPLAVISPLIVQRVVDDAVERGRHDEIWMWGGLLLAITVIGVGFEMLRGWAKTLFDHKVRRDLQQDLYDHVQSLSVRYHRQKETGYLLSRIHDDVSNLNGVMADAFVRAAVDAVTAVAYLAMLFYVEWRMATGGLVLVILIFGLLWLVSPRLRQLTRDERERKAELGRDLHQALTGQMLVRATGSERREARHVRHAIHQHLRAGIRRDLWNLATNHTLALLAGVAPTLIILAGVVLIATGDFSVGGLFAFFMYLMQLFVAVGGIAALIPSLQSGLASLERIYEVLDTEPEILTSPGAPKLRRLEGELDLRGVGFEYEPDRPVLADLDLRVAPRELVAVVGPSGAGKTTLAQLILRFYDPTAGSIRVDGRDLKSLDLRSYRRRLGLVPQDIFLFDRSVWDNLTYGTSFRQGQAEDLQRVRDAAEAASALDFLDALPEGFDTVVGEQGVRLSGGQRQRLAIAREILRDPDILILDEATSSLDAETEARIQEALDRLLEGRTAIVIAHRLSTVERADRILVLDAGRIVEEGKHLELLAQNGLYARLCASQLVSRPEPVASAVDSQAPGGD